VFAICGLLLLAIPYSYSLPRSLSSSYGPFTSISSILLCIPFLVFIVPSAALSLASLLFPLASLAAVSHTCESLPSVSSLVPLAVHLPL
jgi:hypothetical protein